MYNQVFDRLKGGETERKAATAGVHEELQDETGKTGRPPRRTFSSVTASTDDETDARSIDSLQQTISPLLRKRGETDEEQDLRCEASTARVQTLSSLTATAMAGMGQDAQSNETARRIGRPPRRTFSSATASTDDETDTQSMGGEPDEEQDLRHECVHGFFPRSSTLKAAHRHHLDEQHDESPRRRTRKSPPSLSAISNRDHSPPTQDSAQNFPIIEPPSLMPPLLADGSPSIGTTNDIEAVACDDETSTWAEEFSVSDPPRYPSPPSWDEKKQLKARQKTINSEFAQLAAALRRSNSTTRAEHELQPDVEQIDAPRPSDLRRHDNVRRGVRWGRVDLPHGAYRVQEDGTEERRNGPCSHSNETTPDNTISGDREAGSTVYAATVLSSFVVAERVLPLRVAEIEHDRTHFYYKIGIATAVIVATTLWIAMVIVLTGIDEAPAPAPMGGGFIYPGFPTTDQLPDPTDSTLGPQTGLPDYLKGTGTCEWPNLAECGDAVEIRALDGSIPNTIGFASQLTKLTLYHTQRHGTIPTEIGMLTNLVALHLSANLLTGTIPTELGLLTKLTMLELDSNMLTGSVPREFRQLIGLQELYLWGNHLSGSFPAEIDGLTSLRTLSLGENVLEGPIPSQLGLLTELSVLRLWQNRFTSSIPSELGLLTNLSRMLLSQNFLDGSIPSELGRLTNLLSLRLFDNQLVGSIPIQLQNLTSLSALDLYKNRLSGTMPDGVCNTTEPNIDCHEIECFCCTNFDKTRGIGQPCSIQNNTEQSY